MTPNRRALVVPDLKKMKRDGKPIVALTAYDASFARAMDDAGVDVILVGDSLGMVVQGHGTTLPVTLDHMIYHAAAVARGSRRAIRMVDLPFMTYATPSEALSSAARLLREGEAQLVKLEGGGWTTETVRFLVERGIPVCGHLGLTPQTVHALGGYRVQGRQEDGAMQLTQHALALQEAGATMLVIEMVPAQLSAELTQKLPHCNTIGIGAGNGTAGQILVMPDMLGVNLGKTPKFVRNFLKDHHSIQEAFAAYVAAVKDGSFPDNTQHAW